MPFGADRPNQIVTSKPGRPASAIVGTLGSASERVAPVTPSALTLPVEMYCTWLDTVSNIIEMRPPSKSVNAAAEPLYGTWTISMPAIDLNNSPDKWLELPLPAEPKVSAPGFCLASATSSLTLLTGRLFGTTSTLTVEATEPTASNDLSGSTFSER
ncbi:hypothetical protein D3C85_1161430 [compost metagenome]